MPDIQETRVNIAQQMPTTQTGVETLAEARGNRRSDIVQTSSTQSKIAEMAEEIGMSTAHRANRKDLGERIERRGAGTDLDAISRILKMLEKLPDMPKEPDEKKLQDLVTKFRKFEELIGGGGGGDITAEDILEALRSYDGDVTHQDAMLETAIGYFQGVEANEDFVALLKQAKKEFEKPEIRQEILAGLASAKSASETGQKLGLDPAALRNEYRELLRSQPNISQLYMRLAPLVDSTPGDKSQAEKIEMVIDSLLVAAGRDLEAAEGPSGDRVLLEQAKNELQGLKAMRSAIELVATAYDTVMSMRPELKDNGKIPSVTEFTSRVLEFIAADQGAAFSLAKGLVDGFEEAGADVPVLIANSLRQTFTDMPDNVMKHRLEKSAALMNLFDKVVEDEEQAFNSAQAAE